MGPEHLQSLRRTTHTSSKEDSRYENVPPTQKSTSYNHATGVREPSADLDVVAKSQSAPINSDMIWGFCVPVPGSKSKKLIYPKAPVEVPGVWTVDQCHDRFQVVQPHLKDLVDHYLDLDGLERWPTYCLRMVGPDPSSAKPSIVVTCRDLDFKRLHDLFRSKAEMPLRLRIGGASTLGNLFRAQPPMSDSSIPELNLVYNRIPRDGMTVKRQASQKTFTAYIPPNQGCCGSLICPGNKFATLGPPIFLDGKLTFLTVPHVFEPTIKLPDTLSGEVETSSAPTEVSSAFKDGLMDELVPWEDDDEYDDLDIDEAICADTQRFPGAHPVYADQQLGSVKNYAQEPWERVLPQTGELENGPYLDWALARPLVSPGEEPFRLSDLVLRKSDGSQTILVEARQNQPDHLRRVCMVSGSRGILHGQILTGWSYLPSEPGQDYSVAWSVILEAPTGENNALKKPVEVQSESLTTGLLEGECGSVVFDEDTGEVYGHIVGSDPFGIAYVVPLKEVLEQIKKTFGTDSVGLPSNKIWLLHAMAGDNKSMVSTLLDQGEVDFGTQDREGRTPLVWAAQRGHEAVVKQLLSNSELNVDAHDNHGRTAVSWAAERGDWAIVKLLLETGKANYKFADKNGMTPLTYAAVGGHEMIVDLFNQPTTPVIQFGAFADDLKPQDPLERWRNATPELPEILYAATHKPSDEGSKVKHESQSEEP